MAAFTSHDDHVANASTVPTEQSASYSAIIDSILVSADLDTISAKAIRKALQAKVEYDLSEQKVSLTEGGKMSSAITVI